MISIKGKQKQGTRVRGLAQPHTHTQIYQQPKGTRDQHSDGLFSVLHIHHTETHHSRIHHTDFLSMEGHNFVHNIGQRRAQLCFFLL